VTDQGVDPLIAARSRVHRERAGLAASHRLGNPDFRLRAIGASVEQRCPWPTHRAVHPAAERISQQHRHVLTAVSSIIPAPGVARASGLNRARVSPRLRAVAMPPQTDHARWFSEEVQPHEPALRAYLRGRFPSLHDVDDLVQESYARILRARQIGTAKLSRAYLFVTARNLALDAIRHTNVVKIESLAEIDEWFVVEARPDAAEAASCEQELEILADAIATLPKRCREIFVLRRYHELTHREIALRLGIAENTVNAQLVIAMLRCREYLRQRGVTTVGRERPRHE